MQKCMPKTFIWGPVGVQMPRRGATFDADTPQVLYWAYISTISEIRVCAPALNTLRYFTSEIPQKTYM